MKKGRITTKQWVAVIFSVGAAFYLAFTNVGPGSWINELQDSIFGSHNLRLSVLAIGFLGSLLFGAVNQLFRFFGWTCRVGIQAFKNGRRGSEWREGRGGNGLDL